ncbi:hypothetical protein ACSFB8_03660 [Enterococcus faecalis]
MTKRTLEYERNERKTTTTKKKVRPSLNQEQRKPKKRPRPVEATGAMSQTARKPIREKDSVRRRPTAAGESKSIHPPKALPSKVTKKRPSNGQGNSEVVNKKKLQQRNAQQMVSKKAPTKRKPISQGNASRRPVSKTAPAAPKLSEKAKSKLSRTEIHAEKQPKQPRSNFKKVFSIAYHLLITFFLLLLFALGTIFVLFRTETSIFHYQLISVNDNSMAIKEQANIHTGDLLVVKQQSFNQLKVSDIVTFRDAVNMQYTTRRITGFEVNDSQKYLLVQGDAQAFPEEAVAANQIVGKVSIRIAKLASIFSFVQENIFLVLAFCLTFIILLILLRVFLIH